MLLSLSGNLANIGWNYPFLVYGIALVIAAVSWLFIFEPDVVRNEPATVSPTGVLPTRTVVIMFMTTLFFAILYFVYTIHFARAFDAMGIKDKVRLGNLSAIANTGVLGALIFRLVSKWLFWQQMALIFFFFAIGLTGIGLVTDATSAIAIAWIQQLGCGMTIPVLVAWALSILPALYRGMGFWTSGCFLGQFLNPVFMSFMQNLSGGLLPAFRVVGLLWGVIRAVIVGYNLFFKKSRIRDFGLGI